jgi:hypothetical protein
MPLGHCGQLASAPRRPAGRGLTFGSFGTVIDGGFGCRGFGAGESLEVGAELGGLAAWGRRDGVELDDVRASGFSGASQPAPAAAVPRQSAATAIARTSPMQFLPRTCSHEQVSDTRPPVSSDAGWPAAAAVA